MQRTASNKELQTFGNLIEVCRPLSTMELLEFLQLMYIKKLLKNAYLHHIERLMIMGNFLFLLKINPNHVYRWFMELHIDAYDWVMVPNVYGMSQFSDGGLMSTKPYIRE